MRKKMDEPGSGRRKSSFYEVARHDIAPDLEGAQSPDFGKMAEDLISVAELQRRIMPDPLRLTMFGNFDIFGRTLPIEIVGGDFYDFIDLEGRFGLPERMGIVIADASGHGLVPAMLIRDFNTALYTAISMQAHYERDTTPLLFRKINRRLFRSSGENQFITAFYGELHLEGGIRFINAGHYSPLLFKKNRVETLDTGGTVLGAFLEPAAGYQVGEAHMDPGDVLVCYTDGISEAVNRQSVEYGVERLMAVVKARQQLPSIEIFDSIMADVEEFSEGRKQDDDRTVIIIKRPVLNPDRAAN